jgi:hypothetical protein
MISRGENIWEGRNDRVGIWEETQESVYQEDIRERGIYQGDMCRKSMCMEIRIRMCLKNEIRCVSRLRLKMCLEIRIKDVSGK